MSEDLGTLPSGLAGSARSVRTGDALRIGPPRDTEELAAILSAAHRLAPLDAAPDDIDRYGDHLLNPHLAPGPDDPSPRRAAVLLALASDDAGRLSLILTERAAHLSAHPGQIALPGGRIDEGESPADAALREAHEEIALPPSAVRPLGLGDPYRTRTGYLVFPVLAVVTAATALRPNPGEVAAAFTVPIDHALSARHRREGAFVAGGARARFYETTYGDRRIWGVTAGILKLVADRLEVR